jgi:hypothetical protein
MKIEDLQQLLQQRVAFLEQQQSFATERGDVAELLRIETELAETKATLQKLSS